MTHAAQEFRNPFTGAVSRLPLLLCADPGEHKGYALGDPENIVIRGKLNAPRVVCIGQNVHKIRERLSAGGIDARRRPLWTMTELQYTERITSGEISPSSIVKLAFRAGYMQHEMHSLPGATEMFAAPPGGWKPEIFASGGNLRKDVFCEKVKRELIPEELELLKEIDDEHVMDALDAVGIMWALWFALQRPDHGLLLESWRCNEDTILPKSAKSKRTPNKAQRKKLGIE